MNSDTKGRVLTREQSIGKFIKIKHFGWLFEVIHEFLGDIGNFITLINVNKFFRNHCKFSTKIINVIERIKKEKYKLFSPYSWVSNKAQYFYTKRDDFMREFDLNDYEFKILFNLSKRMIKHLDYETFEINTTFLDVFDTYFYNTVSIVSANFGRCKFKGPSDFSRLLSFLGKCPLLEKLDFQDNVMTELECLVLKDKLTNLKHLKEINLKGCKIGPNGTKYLAEFMICTPSLLNINLSYNKLDITCVDYLNQAFSVSANLKVLNVGCNIFEKGLDVLIQNIFEMKSLEDLYLNDTKFSDDNAVGLSKFLAKSTTIKFLSLYENSLTFAGVNEILTDLKKSSLESLDLSMNPIASDQKVVSAFFKTLELLPNQSKLKFLRICNIGNFCETDSASLNKINERYQSKFFIKTSYN